MKTCNCKSELVLILLKRNLQERIDEDDDYPNDDSTPVWPDEIIDFVEYLERYSDIELEELVLKGL